MVEIKSVIQRVVEGDTLTREEAADTMDAVMSGQITGAQIGALVTAIRMRGETVEEITGFASAMREHALTVDVDSDDKPLLDTCGTGGDYSNSFNISTTATFAIAASQVALLPDVSDGKAVFSMNVPEIIDVVWELFTPYCVSTFMYGVPFRFPIRSPATETMVLGSFDVVHPQ